MGNNFLFDFYTLGHARQYRCVSHLYETDPKMTKVYGLIGRRLGHSYSKEYFTDKFSRLGIDARYDNFEIESIEDIRALIEAQPLLRGFNVTIPYKQQIIPLLDSISPEAEAIGAVNMVVVRRSGDSYRLQGYNTDCGGFLESIRGILPQGQWKALILGNGGAAQAVKYVIHTLGHEYMVCSRSKERGDVTYDALTQQIMDEHTLIVNSTPVGMYEDMWSSPELPYEHIGVDHVCVDLVYNPGSTMFMLKCAERGAVVRSGLKMLYAQAELAWQIWSGRELRIKN